MFDDQTPTSPPPPYSAVAHSPAEGSSSPSSSHFISEPPHQTSVSEASAPDLSKLPIPEELPSFAPQPQYQTFAIPPSPQQQQQQSSSSAPVYPSSSHGGGSSNSCGGGGGFFASIFGSGGSKRYPIRRNHWEGYPGRSKKFRVLISRLCLFLSLLFGILVYSSVVSSNSAGASCLPEGASWLTLPHVIRADVGDQVKITLDGWNSKVQLTEGSEIYPTIRIHATPADFANQIKFKTIKSGSQTEVQVEVPSRWKFWCNEAIVEVQAPRSGISLVSNKKVELRAPSVRHIEVMGDRAQIVQPSDTQWQGESLVLQTKYASIQLLGKRLQATTEIQLSSKYSYTKLGADTIDTPVLHVKTSNAHLEVSSHLISNMVDLVASNGYISLSNTVDAPQVSLTTSNAYISVTGQMHAEDLRATTTNAKIDLNHARILRHVEARTSNAYIHASLAGSASDVVSIFTTSNANMDIAMPTYFVGNFNIKTSQSAATIETHEPQAVRFTVDQEYHKQGVYHKGGGGSVDATTSNAKANLAFTAT